MPWLAVCLGLLVASAVSGASQELPLVLDGEERPYVPMLVIGADSQVFFANAVFVDRGARLFVTNAHVVGEPASTAFLRLGRRWVEALVSDDLIDARNDLAVVQARVIPERYAVAPLPLSRESTHFGEVLVVVGTTLEGVRIGTSSGFLSKRHSWPYLVMLPGAPVCVTIPACADVLKTRYRAYREQEMTLEERARLGVDYIGSIGITRQHGQMVRQGLSGSPVLNKDGAVAGIVSAATEGSGVIAVFAPGTIAATLADRARVMFGTGRW